MKKMRPLEIAQIGSLLLIIFAANAAKSQTQIDLRTQSKSVDFSQALATSPVQTGTALPGVCAVGAMYFLTTAPAGANLYACTAINSWIVETGGGSTSSGAGAPAGSCMAGLGYNDTINGNTWFCEDGAWQKALTTDNTGTFVLTGQSGSTPAAPTAGNTSLYFNSVARIAQTVDDTGGAGTMVRPADCSLSGQLLQKINGDGTVTCATPAVVRAIGYTFDGGGSPLFERRDEVPHGSFCLHDRGVEYCGRYRHGHDHDMEGSHGHGYPHRDRVDQHQRRLYRQRHRDSLDCARRFHHDGRKRQRRFRLHPERCIRRYIRQFHSGVRPMRNLIAFFLCALTAYGGYLSEATVTFSASGSTTDTNITLAFYGSDAKLRTTANGGQVYHTVTRAGVTVPVDFVLTADSSCASVTGGYTWGIESYSPAAGTIIGWVKIPSITPGTTVTPSVCLGNAAVNAYQGGSPGAEFDASTLSVYHLPNGVTLNASDFSANANNGSAVAATAATGRLTAGRHSRLRLHQRQFAYRSIRIS